MKEGKIIAIIGSPRSGKSFLARALVDHFQAQLILEGEEKDFPTRIKEDIEKNIRPVERIIWFRNELIKKYLLALEYKKGGKNVILDTFWISSRPYVKPLLSGFERELVDELLKLDEETMSWPDVTLFLDVSDETIKKFIVEGGRKFDSSDEFFMEQAKPINDDHKKIFSSPVYKDKITKINRDDLDFKNPEHLQEIIEIIEKS
jgi:deoxyadenosine/deoxycytidine kinase